MSNLKNPIRLGIAGDGQLGRMMAQVAPSLGIEVVIYGKDRNSPAGQVVKEMVVADYHDQEAWKRFAALVDVVTAEWESVPVSMLQFLEKSVPVHPSPRCFQVSSNRRLEKEFAASLGIATAPYLNITADTVLENEMIAGYLPGILKTCSGGYDGLGQTPINSLQELEAALVKKPDSYVLEKRLNFIHETSVIGARSIMGEIALYPAVRNTHEKGILWQTIFGETPSGDAAIPRNVRKQADRIISLILEELEYVGVLAVEMFVMPDGSLIFNEMAPRVHNSGHWTIEGCQTSQFGNHVLAVCGLPLGPIEPICRGAVMQNLIAGDILFYRFSHQQGRLKLPDGGYFHDYGKAETRAGRKMGHITTIYT